tara:strand:- start:734 stop:1306 length:573 start_codon:yes stop_codon:yes gene_type:complete
VLKEKEVQKAFEQFYQTTYKRKNTEQKAFKDIVGEEYEKYRKQLWTSTGLTAEKGKIANYNADLIVRTPTRKIVALEEAKGHYVDSCFLKRFFSNAAEVADYFIENSQEVPFLILSSPTTFRLFEQHREKITKLYRSDIQVVLREKIKYLTLCEHDRVGASRYYKTNTNCFTLSERKFNNVANFMNTLRS